MRTRLKGIAPHELVNAVGRNCVVEFADAVVAHAPEEGTVL
jgi:hypothetical protein